MPILGICKWTLLVRHRDGGIYQWIEAFNRRGAWNRKGMRFGDVEGKRMSEWISVKDRLPEFVNHVVHRNRHGKLEFEFETSKCIRMD